MLKLTIGIDTDSCCNIEILTCLHSADVVDTDVDADIVDYIDTQA
jgi:hypothetical protein